VLHAPRQTAGVEETDAGKEIIEEDKRFFFEKKNQKTFTPGAAPGWRRMRRAVGALAKVFASFFKKKRWLA
jgi:hypothetical protein